MNRFWTRVFIIAACALTLLFFCNDFGIIDIKKTAIVVAIGIDKSQTNEKTYDVTAQIAVPVSSGSAGADAACQITVKNAATIGEAIAEINSQTGWFPTLVYCNLVLLGEDVTKRNVFDALDYFLRNNFVPDTALVAVVKERCEKILSSKSPINDMSSTAITKTLSSEAQKSGMVMVNNLRDFSKGYYSFASSAMLPFIEIKTASEEQSNTNDNDTSQQSFNKTHFVVRCKQLLGSNEITDNVPKTKNIQDATDYNASNEKIIYSFPFAHGVFNPLLKLSRMKFKQWNYFPVPLPLSSNKSENDKADIFNASKTALFKNGVMVGVLDEEETLAVNIATAKTELAKISVEMQENENKCTYVLQVKTKKQSRNLKNVKDDAILAVKIECSSEIVDASNAATIEQITRTQIVPFRILRAAEKYLENKLNSVFEKSKITGCDVFEVKQSLYRYNYKRYEKLKDSILQIVKPEYKIKFTTFK